MTDPIVHRVVAGVPPDRGQTGLAAGDGGSGLDVGITLFS